MDLIPVSKMVVLSSAQVSKKVDLSEKENVYTIQSFAFKIFQVTKWKFNYFKITPEKKIINEW